MPWLKQQVESEIKKAHLILQLLQGLNYKKIKYFRIYGSKNVNAGKGKGKGTVKRATKNMQLVLQHCYKTSGIALLRFLTTNIN